MKKVAYIFIVLAIFMILFSIFLNNNNNLKEKKADTNKPINEEDIYILSKIAFQSFVKIYPSDSQFDITGDDTITFTFDELAVDGFKFKYDKEKYKCNLDKSYIKVYYSEEHGILKSAKLDCYYK